MSKDSEVNRHLKRVIVPPGSDLDAALTEAEAEGGVVELVHGKTSYQLLVYRQDAADSESAIRQALVAQARSIRDAQEPLDITTAQLIREGRGCGE